MHLESPAIGRILSSMPLFSEMSPECLEILGKSTRLLRFDRGETVFRKGDPAEGFYCVFDGKVKLFFVSERGAEKIIEIIAPGQTFGEAVMFINKPYPVFAETLAESQLLYIQRDSLLEAMQHHQQMALRLLSGLSRRLHGLITGMEALCVQSSQERVVGFLLTEMQETGDGTMVKLPGTKALVASLLNLTPETFSRVLHNFQKEQVLEIQGRTIKVLNSDRLRETAAC